MKKLVMILFVLGFVSAAFAAEEAKKDIPLQVGVSGIVYGTTYKSLENDVEGDYSAARIRPLFNFTNGDIEAVVKLEIDATWGAKAANNDSGASSKTDTDKNTTKNYENVGIGADNKSVEVANAFLKTKIDGVDGLTLKGGIANYDFPLIFGDNVPLANLSFANDMVDFGIYYVKTSEGDNGVKKDDAQIYIADAKIKFGESSIRPAFFLLDSKSKQANEGQYKGSKGYIGGLSANIAVGTFGIDAAAAYAKGKDKSTDNTYNTKRSAYAFDFAPYIKIDTIKVSPFFTRMSGDTNTTDGRDNSFINATISGGGSGINNWRLFILEDGGSFTSNSDLATGTSVDANGNTVISSGKYTNTSGYMAYGLSVEGTFGRLTAKLQGANAQAINVATGKKKDMGIEVDANLGFALTKSSTLYVEGAYLKSGNFFSTPKNDGNIIKKQNAQYVNVGVTYSI